MTGPVHILLIEDHPPDAELTREMLEAGRFKVEVSVADDGVEAMDFLNRVAPWADAARPDLILLDLNLPRKDGRQVLAIIKTDDTLRRIPVIILSSSESQKDITSCYELGANCYIKKPVDLAAYRTVLNTLEAFWLEAAALPRGGGHTAETMIGHGL
jgi:chemotaxis family two-component system response regulator Rcp1